MHAVPTAVDLILFLDAAPEAERMSPPPPCRAHRIDRFINDGRIYRVIVQNIQQIAIMKMNNRMQRVGMVRDTL